MFPLQQPGARMYYLISSQEAVRAGTRPVAIHAWLCNVVLEASLHSYGQQWALC